MKTVTVEQTVRFADIDPAGIVYYPRILHFFHVAMEEYFGRALSIDYPDLLRERRLGFPTVRAEADFRKPLRYGDRFAVEVWVERIGGTSLHWRYALFRRGDSEPAVTGRTVTVALDLDTFAKREVPEWLRQAIEPSAS